MIMGFCRRGSRLTVLASMATTFVVLLFLQNILSQTTASPERLKEAADTLDQCQSMTNNPTQRIPNIIHQIWKDDDLSTYPITASRASWQWVFNKHNYTIKLWTEADIVNLVQTSYPWFYSTYKNYKYNIQRADVARLMVVHYQGGIYADLDAYPNFNQSAAAISCLQNLGYQAILAPTSDDRGISNHFFMAEKDSEFLLWALHEAKKRASSLSGRFMLPYVAVFWSTGPLMITSVMNEYAWLYNQAEKFKTMAVLKYSYIRFFMHHAAGRSWHQADGRALNFVADHFQYAFAPILIFLALGTVGVIVARKWPQIRPRFYNFIRLPH